MSFFNISYVLIETARNDGETNATDIRVVANFNLRSSIAAYLENKLDKRERCMRTIQMQFAYHVKAQTGKFDFHALIAKCNFKSFTILLSYIEKNVIIYNHINMINRIVIKHFQRIEL